VLALTDVALAAGDAAPVAAHEVRAAALEQLARQAINGVERNVYRAAARYHERQIKRATSQTEKPAASKS
jgi:hypothetical protein